jgi:hypothetical protein
MSYEGSCHCGKVAYDVDGEIGQVTECNCSICTKRGHLLWFVPRANLRMRTPDAELAAYTFNRHNIRHTFCPTCGVGVFGLGTDPKGNEMAAINVRCLDGVDPKSLKVMPFDGRSL